MRIRKKKVIQPIVFSFVGSRGDGYSACAREHPIFTQAGTLAELKTNVREAVICHFGEGKRRTPIRLVRARSNRIFGSAKGEFAVPEDFNDRLPKEIEDLFYDE